MASYQRSHPLNVPGSLFTDTSCIDCSTCFHLGPDIFRENSADDKSVVVKQPTNAEEWLMAKRALVSCPTNSIGVKEAPDVFKKLDVGLPMPVSDNVFYMGYTSRDSYGASSYFIQRAEGNILVDSPKFHPVLVKEIEAKGGIKYMVLTHQDDVADHKQYREHFNCERIIHQDDVTLDTSGCEILLEGEKPHYLSPDLKIIMTPGHSKGHINLLYKEKFLFTGDHLFVDQDQHSLVASRSVCWYSWSEQIKSTAKLMSEKFEWVLPGHGGWAFFGYENAQEELKRLVQVMKGAA